MNAPIALVIEDDPQLSQIFKLALQDDFFVETIIDGKDAQERLGQVIPRLIVLDLNLPGVSGSNLLASIRSDARMSESTVMLCTADHRQADTLRDQADFILLKPVSPIHMRQLASRLK